MPFTPYHLGPALAVGLILRRWLHAPTLIVASVALDVEPLLVIVLGLGTSLHGIAHTFLAAIVVGTACGLMMRLLQSRLSAVFRALSLETEGRLPNGSKPGIEAFVAAGVMGSMLHVLLDAPIYEDIQPFFPLVSNPLYLPASANMMYSVCLWLGLAGLIIYGTILISKLRSGNRL